MFTYDMFNKHVKIKSKYQIQYIESINSTNEYAWNLVANNIHLPAIVITKNQTNGKGQRDNKWFSSLNKSLTFSLIINENSQCDQLLSLKIGIAIIEAINKNINIKSHLKWPNDIMINNKKIGGILIEKKKNKIVIGIGINVNEDLSDMNSTIKNKSTSLKIAANLSIELEILLAMILNEFEFYYNQKNYKKIIKKWEENCFHINKNIKFYKNDKITNGKFLGLTKNGNAIINISGYKKIINSGIINL